MTKKNQLEAVSEWLFLPGASGDQTFWAPLASCLALSERARLIGYPGFDGVPRAAGVDDFKSLSGWVNQQVTEPCVLVAQSMGGVLAVLAALAKPELVTHLVLVATSAGADMAALGAIDWVADYKQFYEAVPDWFCTVSLDLSDALATLKQPILLVWGDADLVSPVAVGQYLASCLPAATLKVVKGGQHDLGRTHAAEMAAYIETFMSECS